MDNRNLAATIHSQVKKYADRKNDALFYKEGDEWKGISWKEFGERIDNAAQGLLELGAQMNDMIAIYSGNRPEWVISDYAIMSIKCATVAIYASNTAEQAEYIVDDAKCKIIFVDDQYQYDNVMKFYKGNSKIGHVIVFSKSVKIDENDSNIMYIDDLYERGRKSSQAEELQKRLNSITADDIMSVIYTSGTTGDPKGAMHAHRSFFVEIDALNSRFPMGENDIEVVFLPLSHVYEKASSYWMHSAGASQYFCSDTNKIVEYFGEIRPTYMCGVPRLFEKMYAAIYAKMEQAGGMKKKIFDWGIATGREYEFAKFRGENIPASLEFKHKLAFKLVLKTVRELLGGRLNFFSAGGAPLAREIEEFFFGANIFIAQGYGLTETAPMGSCNAPKDFKFGTAGRPIGGNDVKIADDGEILIKGDNVFKGYWNKAEATAEAMTEDGYFKTGDIGLIDEDGFLKITDRKKDIIITANGKNIAPQLIESRIGQDYYFEQMVVFGDKQKYLTALIVPAFTALEEYAKSKNIAYQGISDLLSKPQIIQLYADRIEGQSKDLAHHEKIVKFTLLDHLFTVENGEMTPSNKIKRKIIAQHYEDVINTMYAE
ncbi:MAG TPA: long-chain fatty acid--CoA ligase [Syntrophomonadaceae bacterium]|nr:long-chain fatty acid--CoA ligase [Syntrophomonadaceae bacterium]HPR94633.1 long-chain fatty acid--CoA ligase [Syntrophomonadaceae bacterium]